MRKSLKVASVITVAAAIATTASIGGAVAASKITGSDIAHQTITDANIAPQTLTLDRLTPHAKTFLTGQNGPKGDKGAQGPKGESGLAGAYYSVAKYDVGDTNGGAVATVACKLPTDVAISGGVQTLIDGSDLSNNVPVSSSFPGRMDWSDNTPKADRLDGWIVQFGTETGNAPKTVNVYALCVPNAGIKAQTTYTESGS